VLVDPAEGRTQVIKACLAATDIDVVQLQKQAHDMGMWGTSISVKRFVRCWDGLQVAGLHQAWRGQVDAFVEEGGFSREDVLALGDRVEDARSGLFADSISKVADRGLLRVVHLQAISYSSIHPEQGRLWTVGVAFEAYHYHVGFLRSVSWFWGPERQSVLGLLAQVAHYSAHIDIAAKLVQTTTVPLDPKLRDAVEMRQLILFS